MTSAPTSSRQRGFTLLELLIVVAIGAMLVQIAVANLGMFIPTSVLDSEANRFISRLDFIRSEAKLNSKTYRVEIDLTHNRWRLVMPIEAHLVSALEPDQQFATLMWTPVDERLEYGGYRKRNGELVKSGVVEIQFDEHGFTGDHALYLRYRADEDMIWSILIRGLVGSATVVPNEKGEMAQFEQVNEHSF